MVLEKGLVIKSTGSRYLVKDDSGSIIECRIKGKLRMKGIRTTNPVTVGDIVYFRKQDEIAESGYDLGIIEKLEKRKNYIIRKSIKLSKESHILAANIDQAFIVVTIKHPVTHLAFIDRFLVTAEAYNIPAVIVFNKIDIYNDSEMEKLNEWFGIYHEIGYTCLGTSCQTGQGIDDLKAIMKDKISVFAGHSGVGKSSLINTIDPDINITTSKISDMHKSGKHTTTFSEMHPLSFNGYIVDTPGIKAFGMIDMEYDQMSHYFPEIFEASNKCKFNNCTHSHEPGCAVIKAVENGEIALSRYENYYTLLHDDEKEKFRTGY